MLQICEVCGNEYDKSIQVSLEGPTMTFDSFECAIHAMAATCAPHSRDLSRLQSLI